MTPGPGRIPPRLREEAGFTLIELMVAVLILTIGLLSLVGTIDSSRALTGVSERKQSVAHVAERELERILALPYGQVGLTAAPAVRSSDPNHPDFYLTTDTPPQFQWDREVPARVEPLFTTGGTIAPTDTWTSGRLSGTVHRYVTRAPADADCRPSPCGASDFKKRVTVAVTVNGARPAQKPVLASALVVDPNDGTTAAPGEPLTECVGTSGQLEVCEGDGGAFTAWHLYDTKAGPAPNPRLAVSANHNTHPTVARTVPAQCTNSTTNYAGCPQPDLMGTTPPPADPVTPLFNYSYEQVALRTSYAGGRVLQKDTTTCTGTPTADNMKSAMWVSPPLSAAKTLTGRGGMSVWSQTLNGAEASGTLCVAIYDVPNSLNNLTSTGGTLPVELGRSSFTFSSWPVSLSPQSFSFGYRGDLGAATVAADRRIGVRLWLSSTSSAEAVALLYDDHDYQSIVQLNEE